MEPALHQLFQDFRRWDRIFVDITSVARIVFSTRDLNMFRET